MRDLEKLLLTIMDDKGEIIALSLLYYNDNFQTKWTIDGDINLIFFQEDKIMAMGNWASTGSPIWSQ